MKIKYLIPFFVFLAICGFLILGLGLDPQKIPSPLINKPAPDFSLPQLIENHQKISNQDMENQVWLLNVWASWCPSCREEHPLLMEIAKLNLIPIIGLNWKDEKKAAINVLNNTGNPYRISGFDPNNEVGINFGIYGAPESFIIDKKGIIRYKHIGPLTNQIWQEELLPIINKLLTIK